MKPRRKRPALKPTVNVQIIEHDSWSGPTLIKTIAFRTEKAAINFCTDHNRKHCPPLKGGAVPDYYVRAGLERDTIFLPR